jgi:hypothetical protein
MSAPPAKSTRAATDAAAAAEAAAAAAAAQSGSVAMGTPQLLAENARTLQAAATAAVDAAAAAAALAHAVPLAAAAAPGGAPAASATEQVLAALLSALSQQNLMAQAQLAQASADAAARAAQSAADAARRAAAEEASRAQVRAGAAPLFTGKYRAIEAHRWLTALERWFAAAHIRETDEATRLEVAAASLRESAQAWWAAKVADGTAAALRTWALFAAAVRAQFLPRDVEDWALQERDALVANAAKNRNVLDYTAKFEELAQLLPGESVRSTVSAYARGLPEAYAVKCAERRFASLAEATAAMTVRWHAKESAHHKAASLSNTEVEASSHSAASRPAAAPSATSSAPGTDTGSASLAAQVAQLTAMMTERFQSLSQRGRGGRNRQREGAGEKRPPRERTPGLSSGLAQARIRAGQCIKCGQEGHYKAECTNEVKLN